MTDSDSTFDVLRFLPEEKPWAYERLPADEKAWRGRYFLMVLSMGASEEYAWANALERGEAHVKETRALVLRTPDHQIVEALKLRDEQRPELPETPGGTIH